MNVDTSPIEKVALPLSYNCTDNHQPLATMLYYVLHRRVPQSHTKHNIACDVTHNTTKRLHHDLNRRLVNRLLPGFLYIM